MPQSNIEPLNSVQKAWLAIGLTWVAGFVDIVGYTVLKQILNANMSGNTVLIPYHLFQHGPVNAGARAWAVLMFVVGLIACACIHEACLRHGILSSAAVTLGLEALLLGAFVAAGERYASASGRPAATSGANFLFAGRIGMSGHGTAECHAHASGCSHREDDARDRDACQVCRVMVALHVLVL